MQNQIFPHLVSDSIYSFSQLSDALDAFSLIAYHLLFFNTHKTPVASGNA